MLEIKLNADEKFVETSNIFPVNPDKKYKITSTVIGHEGKSYSGYFGVVILDENNEEIERKIQWLNDFSKIKKEISLVFQSPHNSKHLVIIYRINHEVPVRSKCQFEMTELEKIKLHEIEDNLEESYQHVNEYQISFEKEISTKDENQLEKNLVWIFASARSGTSWLGLQLLSHNTASINEPLIGLHLGTLQDRITDRIVRSIELFGNEPNYFFAKQFKQIWKHFLRKLILNRIYAQFQSIPNRIIIKEPNGSMAADIIAECLPQSKIILLLRDGRDTIDSKVDSWSKDAWTTKKYGVTPISDEIKPSRIKRIAMKWVKEMEILEKCYENHSAENRIKVKYENLRTDTITELEKIYKFIDINISKEDLQKIVEKYSFENIPDRNKGPGKVTRSASPGKWKENFSEEEQTIMNKIMGDTLNKLGYN